MRIRVSSLVFPVRASLPGSAAPEFTRQTPFREMTAGTNPVPVSLWLLSLCSIAWAGLHCLSCFQLISPQAVPGLPKRLSVLRVNDLVLVTYDSDMGRLTPRSGYSLDYQGNQQFWSEIRAWYQSWDSWVETEYQVLVREMNASAPQAEYHMQVLKTCGLDDVTGEVRAITRYALNGEDVLEYSARETHWFAVHPAARPVAERWNHAWENSTTTNVLTLQQCRTFIRVTAPFTAKKTAQPTARVVLVPGSQAQPRRLICHVTGFYPHDIEVTWEQGGQVVPGEQLSSGIRPNGDPTFQIQVSIELGQEGAGPTEHVCVARHSSLRNTPLRVTWDSKATDQTVTAVIVGVCILAALGVAALGALVWHLRRKSVRRRLNIDHTHPCRGESWHEEMVKLESISKGEIIGRREAKPHSRPYMAYLKIQDGDDIFNCGGFLVAKDFVLTAAHCQGDEITVTLGAHDVSEEEDSQQVIPVRRQIPHPNYNGNTYKNDIMLLQLSKEAELNSWVNFIALPNSSERVKPGTVCSVAGWDGTRRKSEFTNWLQEADVVVLEDKMVLRNPAGPYCHYDRSTMLCAGQPETGQDPVSCGFGGGPLVCEGRAHGIVSWGPTVETHPTVYSSVAAFIPWIKWTMRHPKPSPPQEAQHRMKLHRF